MAARVIGLCTLALLTLLAAGAGAHAQAPEGAPVRWAAELTGAGLEPGTGSDARGVFHAWPIDGGVRYKLLLRDLDRATEATLRFIASGEDIAYAFRPSETTTESPLDRPLEHAESQDDFDSFTSLDWGGRFTDKDFCGFQCGAQLFGSLRGDMDGFIAALDAGRLQVVVRSKAFPDGEIGAAIRQLPPGTDPPMLAPVRTSGGGSSAWAWAIGLGAGAVAVLVAARAARSARAAWTRRSHEPPRTP